MKKILLLGGNGYIGSRFYLDSCNRYAITSIDLCLFGQDLGYSAKLDYRDLTAEFIWYFDCIVCLAGHSSVQLCSSSPDRSWKNNVDGFRQLCEKIDKRQLLIYASSASVYGKTKNATENSRLSVNSISDYDLQKSIIDLIANRFINQQKRIIGLRLGTVNGLSPNTRSELLINAMTQDAIGSGLIHVKNRSTHRAVLGINDLTRALQCIIDTGLPYGQYNLSSFNTSIDSVSRTISKLTKAKILLDPDDATTYDFTMSTKKFENLTGFVFADTIETLATEFIDGHVNSNLSTRLIEKPFEDHYNTFL